MIPNLGRMNPALLKKLKKQLGSRELDDVVEVVIKKRNETLVFKNPTVAEMNMMGQKMYQVIGEPEIFKGSVSPPSEASETGAPSPEEEEEFFIEEDVKLVAERAGVSEEEARKALKETKGDIAEAIMKFL
ncbi:MAG TPA: nascent polypeptide-associated complex protein [Thermoplasmata archaeon]|nr:nascent polypeptide-associated complex protein [Thermoplasmata archaeon]